MANRNYHTHYWQKMNLKGRNNDEHNLNDSEDSSCNYIEKTVTLPGVLKPWFCSPNYL